MAHEPSFVDSVIDGYVSPPDDPAGRTQALATLRAWHIGIENSDLPLLESLMHPDIVIQLPFSESGRTEEGCYRVYKGKEDCVEFWRVASTFEGESRPFTEMDLTVNPDGSRLFLEMRGDITMRSGVEYRNRYVLRVDFENGRIRGYREYYNPIISAHAFGRPIAGQFKIERL